MMERLTGCESIAGHCHNIPLVDTQLVVDRLASYEDTGLTPEICAEYKKFEDECIAKDVTFKHILELIAAEKDRQTRPDTVWYLKKADAVAAWNRRANNGK